MKIDLLRLRNLRCFEAAEFQPGPGVNWLIGPNGAGKTTLLEAAYILSHGRSFRTGARSAPCRHGAPNYLIYAETSHSDASTHRLGLSRRGDRWEARLDGTDIPTLARLFEVCPVVFFGPESPSLITGPGDERRSFLDWSVFHVEHRSLDVWRRWRRALRQRNALLRTHADPAVFEPWEHDLGRLAEEIHRMRNACLTSLQPYVVEEASALVPEFGAARFEYRPGWDESVPLAQQLAAMRERDRERGFTQRGAHRADWALEFERIARREHLSRGQAKAVALVCVLGLVRWLKDRTADYPLLCLDDLESELDAEHTGKVIRWVTDTPLQVWITATSAPKAGLSDACTFHVEHSGVAAEKASAGRV
jgi:DNA replication and repair protein RecF